MFLDVLYGDVPDTTLTSTLTHVFITEDLCVCIRHYTLIKL